VGAQADVRDARANSIDVRHHIGIPDAEYIESGRPQIAITSGVHARFVVLASVNLDDKPRFQAGEVREVRVNCDLSPETEAVKLFVAQPVPEDAFGIG